MSRNFSPIKDVNDSKETWRLVVRVVDFWSVINNKGKEHLEMVIMDVSGDRIQVLIRSDNTPKWKARIRENMSCIINNGTVYDNDFQWKLCDHDKKFVFIGGTTVKEVDIQNLPPKRFFFKDFTDILGGNCEMNRLEDIIGVVQEINNFQYNNSGKKSFVSLSLKDLKGVIVNCTLWESYGTKILDFYHDEKTVVTVK
ncbi:replication protein A 70 kDa DNA-binding subunit A-like [Vicia villosa]|uniref:replication protein A 70 kDa DNA-binding subunit A-like n=1 Tax=Vicia villosa TaxID=3911 RepID=UPI00273C2B21|nr:replication protein A 70 kDa DNA-binding subunit A-like [Vicia villosa]